MWGMRWVPRALTGIVLAAGLGLVPAAPAAAAVPVLVLDGAGFGHGVGLSQWGAEYLARTGLSTNQILATFYPGVQMGEAAGTMRVAVHQPSVSTTTLTFPQGGEVRSTAEGEQAEGFPVRVGPGGRVRVLFDGAYRVTALVTGQSSAPATAFRQQPCELLTLCPPPTTAPPTTTTTQPPAPASPAPAPGGGSGGGGGSGPSGGETGASTTVPAPAGSTATATTPVVAVPAAGGVTQVDDRGRSYRGAVEANADGGLRLINIVGVEDYLRGMAEVPSTWPPAAVQAQTVAARTYALRAVQSSGEICDDARCQVYVGAGAESPGQDAAVAATAKRVLAYDGKLAAAVYSADAGGVSANTFEGFGTPDGVYPYLRNVPYETDNPLPWHVEISLEDLGGRFGYVGTVTGARLGDRGPSGRALQVVLEGSSGDEVIDGRGFARSLGLRSTRFDVVAGTSESAPPPPPPAEEPLQALPDDVGALARQPLRPASEAQLDRRVPVPAEIVTGALPEALDPRRHPVTVLAIVLLALVVGAQAPVVLAGAADGVRSSTRWRTLTRRR